MSSIRNKLDMQSGSAGRHVITLLALVMLCYFGVRAFYGRIDLEADGHRDKAEHRPAGARVETVQVGDGLGEIDKEAITRRNLFLPSAGLQGGGTSDGPMDSGEGAEPDLLLVGTIIETGGLNRAVILDVEEEKQVMLSEGDMINGVSVRQIDSGKVVINRQGQSELLDIADAAKIRAAIMDVTSDTTTASRLRATSALPENSLGEDAESEDQGLRIDLNKLSGKEGRVIVKGRISENI